MEEGFLRDHPELRPFVLSDVQLTGTKIGEGAYGQVEEVAFPVGAAAKTIHAILQGELTKAAAEFVRECQLMSTVCHPNVVQFLGVAFFSGSRLPALVMERLLTSLHDLLAPEIPPLPGAPSPLAFFSAVLKCSVLHNVACGLAYLHGRSPPVIHRDLSARNVLLNWDMVAKIADLGVARIIPRISIPVTMTKGPGASVYMPPEASAPAESNREKSKYDASIDIFSLGVVTIFTIGGAFPCNPLPYTYVNEETGLVVGRTELQRHSGYMAGVNQQLRACGQLRGDHPLIRLIQQCLQNLPAKRPGIGEVLRLLEEARAGFRDGESERNRRGLVRALQTQPRNQNLSCVLRDLVTENADLQSRVVELQSRQQSVEREFQSRVQTKDRELAEAQQQLKQKDEQLSRKAAELTSKEAEITKKEAVLKKAEETIRREQQQNKDMRQRAKDRAQQLLQQKETELVQAKDRVQQQLRQKEQQLARQGAELTRQGAELTRQEAELMRAEEIIRREQQQNQEMRQRETELVQAKDRAQQQLRQKEEQLRSSEALVADFQKALQKEDTQATKTQSGLLGYTVPHSTPAKPRKLTVQCHQKKRAPCNMKRGSAATDGRFVYITPIASTSPYQYECSTEKWMELPSCPYEDSGLAIIDSELTTVGGWDRAGCTNRLFTLRQGKWVEEYPPMNTARSRPAVVSTSDGDYLIVIGGWGSDGARTATVELFQVKSRRWYKLTDLPQPLHSPSATICGDQLHVIGEGYSCSLQSLPSNDRPITSPLTLSWKPLPPLPVKLSTAATLCGQLVLIGGMQGGSPVNSIHQLVEGQWVDIGSMTSDRWFCLAVSLSPDRILIASDSVEECVAV